MADPGLNAFLDSVYRNTGIKELSDKVYQKYNIVFNAKTIIPEFNKELEKLKIDVVTWAAEDFKKFDERIQKDADLARNVTPQKRYEFVAGELIPKINSAASLIRLKYPFAVEYLLNDTVKNTQKKITHDDDYYHQFVGKEPRKKGAKKGAKKRKH